MNRSGKTDAVQIGGNDNHPEKMVASRKDLADAIQSYSDNDNHPEKMGNRQQQTNPADVAAFPRYRLQRYNKM